MACTFTWSLCLWLFLWGYFKAEVYTTRPRTTDELKITIQSKFQWYQKTWWGEHWETCKQGWKSVYTMMATS
jgi:hypothetical protein